MRRIALAASLVILASYGASAQTNEQLVKGATDTSNVLNYGMGYNLQRFSTLNQINKDTVKNLVPVWNYSLNDDRSEESQPLVYQGVLYVTTHNATIAIDAKTGKQIWKTKVEYPAETPRIVCCGIINRGAALYDGKLFRTTLDANVIALDAKTGKELWREKAADIKEGYSMTVAPLVADGVVITGISGAEFGTRGFIDGWDPATGKKLWRTYTIPTPDEPGGDTWKGDTWKLGGGSTWITGSYDAELNTVYWGIGNPGPFNAAVRPGDNLYTCSVLALDPKTGKIKWHYQFSPNNPFDYDSVAEMVLADMNVEGKPTKVLMDANRNGFFYVLDRTNGKFISAKNFVDVNWATGYDANGRPIEVPAARGDAPYDAVPGPYGAHNWHPMSFNPQTGLVYLPAQNVPVNLTPEKSFAQNAATPGKFGGTTGWNVGFVLNGEPPKAPAFGKLIAWDPVKQKEAWKVDYVSPWNGGTLTTAGNLVFQGTADGRFVAYDATSGKTLWETPTGTGVVAAASTYTIDGQQYVSIAVGWGGVFGIATRATEYQNPGTVYTFALNGKAKMPEFVKYQTEGLLQGVKYDPKDVPEGTALYVAACATCHGVPGVDRGGNVRNLGYVPAEEIANLKDIVFAGPFRDRGMPDFTGKLTEADVVKIQAFIQGTADAIRPKSK